MNRKNAKILLIGGDLRQLTAADELKRLGYTVSVCGFGTYAGAEYKDAIHLPDGTDAVLLPVPVFRGEYMNLPFSEERVTPERLSGILRGHTRLVCGGMIPAELSGELEKSGAAVYDLCESDGFNIMNAGSDSRGRGGGSHGQHEDNACRVQCRGDRLRAGRKGALPPAFRDGSARHGGIKKRARPCRKRSLRIYPG